MNIRLNLSLFASLILALALAACGDDGSPTGGGSTDKTAPSLLAVTPIDEHHIEITYNEKVTTESAEQTANYAITSTGVAPVSPGAQTTSGGPIHPSTVGLKNDGKTAVLFIFSSMAGFTFDLVVTGVSDLSGNVIGDAGSSKSFTGSSAPDHSGPYVISQTPAAGATNVSVNTNIVLKLSERMSGGGISLAAHGGDNVNWDASTVGAITTITMSAPLSYNTSYSPSFDIYDLFGNHSLIEWTFTTESTSDHTPPALASASPANLATNVDVSTNFTLTFSEAIEPRHFTFGLIPDVGDGTTTWSNGGKTVTFDPNTTLAGNTQYTLNLLPQHVADLAGGNHIAGTSVVFTTGASIADGSIAGTASVDPGSPSANAGGALLIAGNQAYIESFSVVGSTTVGADGAYSIPHLTDGSYFIYAMLDTNHDGILNTSTDAFGGYGVTESPPDFDADPVQVTGGAHVMGKDFVMIDPSSLSGNVTYNGNQGYHPVYAVLFPVAGFTGMTGAGGYASQATGTEHWWIFSSPGDLAEGDYYVGAFMDANEDLGAFQPSEPWGFYGGFPSPIVVHLKDGNDVANIHIAIADPTNAMVANTPSVKFQIVKPSAALERLANAVRQGQLQSKNK